MVLPDSHRISRVLWYSGTLQESIAFHIPGCHRLRLPIPWDSATQCLYNSYTEGPTTPLARFRLVPVRSPLLGESLFAFSSSGYLDVSVPQVGFLQLCIHCRMAGRPSAGFPIRRPPDRSLFAAPRGFSQLSASFIASRCLGIHRAPFVA